MSMLYISIHIYLNEAVKNKEENEKIRVIVSSKPDMYTLSAPQECIVYGKQSFKDNPDLKDSRYKYVIISEAFNYTYLLG